MSLLEAMAQGPVVWLCIHGEPADLCDKCEDEDCAINGDREVFQCPHEMVDMDGVCVDCKAYCE